MNPTSPARTVLDEVATWTGITTQPTPRGATAILFEGHELGHLHANRGTLDLPLPADQRAQVLEAGRAKEWFSGWVTKQIASRADADDGIALLREGYDALRAPLASSARSQPGRSCSHTTDPRAPTPRSLPPETSSTTTTQTQSSSPSGNRSWSKRYAQTDSAAGLQSHQTSLR
jgi:hypothetical protein